MPRAVSTKTESKFPRPPGLSELPGGAQGWHPAAFSIVDPSSLHLPFVGWLAGFLLLLKVLQRSACHQDAYLLLGSGGGIQFPLDHPAVKYQDTIRECQDFIQLHRDEENSGTFITFLN